MRSLAQLSMWIGALFLSASLVCADDSDLAIALVYDTSGSMAQQVKSKSGLPEAKYKIANRALQTIVERLAQFQAASGRQVQAGLFTFSDRGARETVPLGPFDAARLTSWLEAFQQPQGGTPLGNAIVDATRALWRVKAGSRHVLIITDGENTSGPKPEALIPGLQDECLKNGLSVYFHFVAFDVDAGVFSGVKKFGSTVLGATDEAQLNEQIGAVLAEKILLEKE